MQDYALTPEQQLDAKKFSEFSNMLYRNFVKNIEGKRLYTIKSDKIWESYLATFPSELRQEQNCSCCKSFIRKFGVLCTLNEKGEPTSPLWDMDGIDEPEFEMYRKGVEYMASIVATSPVNGVFYSKEQDLGAFSKGGWNHYFVKLPQSHIETNPLYEAHELRAKKYQEYQIVSRGLGVYTKDVVIQAVKLLESEALYREGKFMKPASLLLKLHNDIENGEGWLRGNLIWKFIGDNDPSVTHITSNIISSLLDDIKDGLKYQAIKRRWDHKVDPNNYLRPKADASSANIKRAEEIVKKLGIEESFPRKYANFEDIQYVWIPKAPYREAKVGGIFGHLKAKDAKAKVEDIKMDPVTITWDKFARKVLPNAVSMELRVPYGNAGYTAMVTAVNLDAPNILKWDNPVSWYTYHGGSRAEQWGLKPNSKAKVTGIHFHPSQWNVEGNYERGVIMTLEGCSDSSEGKHGLALFPEILKHELHEVRKTIEQFSQNGVMENGKAPTGSGINVIGQIVYVTSDLGVVSAYKIDRLD